MASNNALVEIPEGVMFMHQLESLAYSHNEVSTWPESLCKVDTLKSIMMDNYLEHLPSEINLLTNLTELNLSSNLLEDVCPQMAGLTSLLNLQLTSNRMQYLNGGVGG